MTVLDEHWRALVSAALLGTDRREPPLAPPGALADLAADDVPRDAPGRVLQQAAAITVSRRAGLAPSTAADAQPLSPPPVDDRPVISPEAARAWHEAAVRWPVLEDEWLLAVVRSGHRLSPELVVPLLVLHRGAPVRHALVRRAAGPLADWLIGWSARLGPVSKRPVPPASITELPALSVTADLLALLAAGADEPLAPSGGALGALVDALLLEPLRAGRFQAAHRAVLVNVLARIHPGVLGRIGDALRELERSPTTVLGTAQLAASLADLVTMRSRLLGSVQPRSSHPTPNSPLEAP